MPLENRADIVKQQDGIMEIIGVEIYNNPSNSAKSKSYVYLRVGNARCCGFASSC